VAGIWHRRAVAATGRMAGAVACGRGLGPPAKKIPGRCRTPVPSFVLGVGHELQKSGKSERKGTPMTAASSTRPAARRESGKSSELALATIAARAAGTARTLRGLKVSTDDGSDEALMARVADGDRGAIRLLFARYQLRVYHFVLRLVGNSATAEDIVSDVFLDLWRHAANFEGRARLSTWILAIARNKAVSAMRRRCWMQASGAPFCADASSNFPRHIVRSSTSSTITRNRSRRSQPSSA
jgi:hypothetical protein